ncbi:unnamed protein product [Mesocestoides corti]|uniref:Rho GDP-dissociation inhibitor n=1 Tax=Mesocestoides corti TaxID=53468 RepID=A0A0R3U4I3_MESCO|nr:unnamed protein product [Mesocestoides corti]
MAAPVGDEADLIKTNDGYKAPEKKTIDELVKLDAEDESLKRYKESLLGGTKICSPFPNDPRKFILQKLEIVVEGGPTHEIDLSSTSHLTFSFFHFCLLNGLTLCLFLTELNVPNLDLDKLRDNPIEMIEGSQYHVQITFFIQHDIVAGLRYAQSSTKKVFRSVETVMLGSYAPRESPYVWRSEDEEVQSGVMFRGHYNITSVFTDDDDQEHLKFKWAIKIVKP